jgi:hypothetical protein
MPDVQVAAILAAVAGIATDAAATSSAGARGAPLPDMFW